MKKQVIFLLFLVLCSVFVVSSSYAPDFQKPERIDVPKGSDVDLQLHVGEVVEVRVREGTKIYFPIEGVEADFWVQEVTKEHVKGQLSVKGGRYADKTILRDDMYKSNALKINVYGGAAADILIRYRYYTLDEEGDFDSAILIFDVFQQATKNPDGSVNVKGKTGDIQIQDPGDVQVVDKEESSLKYFYVVIGLLVIILVYIIFFKKGGKEEESVYKPSGEGYGMESSSEPIENIVDVGSGVENAIEPEKKTKKKKKKK